MIPQEQWHGTVGGYTNHKCRCADCKEAAKIYRQEQKAGEHHITDKQSTNTLEDWDKLMDEVHNEIETGFTAKTPKEQANQDYFDNLFKQLKSE